MSKRARIMKVNPSFILYAFVFLTLLSSCSNLKYLPQGEDLYVKGEVELKPDSTFPKQYIGAMEEHLEGFLTPKPNSTFLGLRPKLYFYNLGKENVNGKGIKGWLKNKVGEPPVLLSNVNRGYNEGVLRNRLENLGFFDATVRSDTTIKKRKATITYIATPFKNYQINEVHYEFDSLSTLGKIIQSSKEQSLLQPGRPYNLDVIKSERERIDNELKDKGFYYSDPTNFIIQVDSTIGDHKVNMYVKMKEEVPVSAKVPYTINNVYVFPNYNISQGDYPKGEESASVEYHGINFVDPERTYRKFALERAIFLKKGDLYHRAKHNRTISQLVGFGTFKFVKNNFVPVDTAKNLLDVYYYLTPLPKKAIRLEAIAKTASVYNGSELNLSWYHRNAFKGAEQLRISVFGGYEYQTGGSVNLNSTFYRYGAKATLSFPRLITPFNLTSTRNFVPHTNLSLGYEFMNRRNAYELSSLTTSFGYVWKENAQKEHELNVLDVGLVRPRKITAQYQEQIQNNPNLMHAIDRQFTFGSNYYFTYTNTMQSFRKHTQYFRGGLDLSGNIYGIIKGSNYKKGNIHQLFNTNFSQYIKLEADFRNYTRIGTKSQLALRAMLGYGYAYGNSSSLPYVKQFYVGGPNSLRGFRARALGPGSFYPEIGKGLYFPDMTGDIKIEVNAEYRPHLFGFVNGAVFLEAGNIWLLNEDPDKPGGKFSKSFLKEMAVGAGVGLRFDFTFLVLRTDLGIPLRLPYLPEKERWVINKIDFGDSEWRKSNLIFNLAIGYPF